MLTKMQLQYGGLFTNARKLAVHIAEPVKNSANSITLCGIRLTDRLGDPDWKLGSSATCEKCVQTQFENAYKGGARV